jgi:hypothetical protein
MMQSTTNPEWTEAERQEVNAEALHHPESAEEWAAQPARFQAWLKDKRYQHLWPMLARLMQAAPANLAHEAIAQPTALCQ